MENRRAQTVLVIDDDASVQTFVAKTLEKEGYQVLVAADVQEALHVSDDCPTEIHLIVSDIMLPTGNGMALAQALLTKRPNTPVLYMSGADSEMIHTLQFEGAPVGGFLRKPFSPTQLAKTVEAMLPPSDTSAMSEKTSAQPQGSDAVYKLENPVRCAQCREMISSLQAVRLLRTQVNFTSTLPRRGRVLVCPLCASIVSAELTAF